MLGVTDPAMADCLRAIPTSRSDTGPATLAALRDKGISVKLVAELADVDTVDDVEVGSRRMRTRQSIRPGDSRLRGSDMLGNLYDRALDGERCWIRHDDGEVRNLPVRKWLGGRHAD